MNDDDDGNKGRATAFLSLETIYLGVASTATQTFGFLRATWASLWAS